MTGDFYNGAGSGNLGYCDYNVYTYPNISTTIGPGLDYFSPSVSMPADFGRYHLFGNPILKAETAAKDPLGWLDDRIDEICGWEDE